MNDRILKVLLVDDCESIPLLIHNLLSDVKHQKYQFESVETYESGLTEMKRNQHDVYLVDYYLDEQTGVDLLREASACELDAPVILLTGQGGHTVDVEAMQAGATDYLEKGRLNGDLLERSIRYAIDRKQTEHQMIALNRELEHAQQLQEDQAAKLAQQIEQLKKEKLKSEEAQQRLASERFELEVARTELEARNLQLENAVSDLQKAQTVLLQSEKLASVGQLAAGIAHEINTPIQFIGDNVRACSDMFSDLQQLISEYQVLLKPLKEQEPLTEEATRILQIEEEIDVEYLFQDIPKAIDQSLEGIERVRAIVQAMKDFTHGGKSEKKSEFNVITGLNNTLTVARNELKYVANIETNFEDIPTIQGYPGELNQVFLNMLINAAHAIKEKDSGELGTISIGTRLIDNSVVVSIADTGCGMPDSVRRKIFDPFFTTKEVGKGTGQGLAISFSIVVDRHGGRIEVETEDGVGTTFHIYLPLNIEPAKDDQSHDLCTVC